MFFILSIDTEKQELGKSLIIKDIPNFVMFRNYQVYGQNVQNVSICFTNSARVLRKTYLYIPCANRIKLIPYIAIF